MSVKSDIVIIGAGPAGLCFAKSLAETGLQVTILERQTEASLADPAFDGREIALTHHSAKLMREFGLWDLIDAEAISDLKDAQVFNGPSLFSLDISHRDTKREQLGYLISNHLIRKAAYEAAKPVETLTLKTETSVEKIIPGKDYTQLILSDGEEIQTKLLIGADSRFSETRRALGIAADMHDFGKTMMVCVMEHEQSHQHIAWEWFDYGRTLAMLPMNGAKASVVITLEPEQINHLMSASEEVFNQEVTAMFKHRLGAMKLVSTRHAYPLVTVYAKRLVGERFALIGDAAVGMHPVTAHGFNFGLKGIATLSAEIKTALGKGQDIVSQSLLSRYEQKHRRDTRPLFLATHAIAKLYAKNSLPARLLRSGALRIGSRIKPFKHAVAGFLADAR